MQAYPTYYPQMNNNGYGQQQYGAQQQYYDRFQNFPQYQQNLQTANQQFQQQQIPPVGISGKIVNNIEMITANDVPMDGSVAFFPMQDMSQILAKSWNSDGTIKTVVYRPYFDSQGNENKPNENIKVGFSEEVANAFMAKFNELSEKIDKLEQSIAKPVARSTSRTKKEAD